MPIKKSWKYLLIFSATGLFLLGGCAKKPSQEELSRLDESKAAAESAEKKLRDLRKERMDLEATLDSKKSELQKLENERDGLKNQAGK
jgi:septal ring factor EnvC (AmiA/AmiB activator)